METEKAAEAISVHALKHPPGGGEGNPDENDNDTGVKRLKTSPESLSECAVDGGNSKPAEDGEPPEAPQRLDVPSKELQCIQKQVLIERLMTSPGGPTSGGNDSEKMEIQSEAAPVPEADVQLKSNQTSKKPFKIPQNPPRKTFKIQSSVLSSVKSFLVEMKNANEELLRLPDPSKISLESDSDLDEMDGPTAGTSASFKKTQRNNDEASPKTFVEMNIALVDHSDSDTSSDDEDFQFTKKLKAKSSPIANINPSSSEAPNPVDKTESPSKDDGKQAGGKKSLITELN